MAGHQKGHVRRPLKRQCQAVRNARVGRLRLERLSGVGTTAFPVPTSGARSTPRPACALNGSVLMHCCTLRQAAPLLARGQVWAGRKMMQNDAFCTLDIGWWWGFVSDGCLKERGT